MSEYSIGGSSCEPHSAGLVHDLTNANAWPHQARTILQPTDLIVALCRVQWYRDPSDYATDDGYDGSRNHNASHRRLSTRDGEKVCNV